MHPSADTGWGRLRHRGVRSSRLGLRLQLADRPRLGELVVLAGLQLSVAAEAVVRAQPINEQSLLVLGGSHSWTDTDMSWPRHSSTGLRRGLGRDTELREPVLHVEVEPVARDNPILDRRDVALVAPHTPARRGNGFAVRPRH